LVKADKVTMATSVELRVPLLDFKILEFAASLPETFKVRGWSTKRVLKAALAMCVPEEILNRKKTGLPVPYDTWLRRELKEFVADLLTGPGSRIASYVNKDETRKLVRASEREGGAPAEVFCLLVLELCCRQFEDRAMVN
jgi:asparagine synthase (glutamine-hydrolysing)